VNVQSKKLLLTFLLIFLFIPYLSCLGWTVNTGPKFHTGTGTILFENSISVGKIKFTSARVEFTSIRMDGLTLDTWHIKASGGTVTINDLFLDKKVKFTVSGSSGDSYSVTFYTAGLGRPSAVYKNGVEVDEGKGWDIDANDDITVTGTFASSDTWEFLWTEAPSDSAGGSGSAGGTGTSGAGGYVPIVPIVRPEVDLRTWGVVAVAGVIGFAVLVSQYQESKRTWKTRTVKGGRWKSKKEKKVKWKRKKKVFD